MCNKSGVRFHHVCILLSPRTCIPVIPADLCSRWSEPHPALSRWTCSWNVEVSTINLLTVIRSHLKFISRLGTWRRSYWSGVLSDFQILEERSDGCTLSEHRDLGLSEKSLHSTETHCLLELGDEGGILLSSPSAIDLLIWYSVALQSQSMFGDRCAQPNSLFETPR